METGYEEYYLRFPHNKVDQLSLWCSAIDGISILENGIIQLFNGLSSRIIYELDSDMRLSRIDFTNRFVRNFERFREQGKISGSLIEIRQEILNEGILYFEGEHWTKTPMMTEYWNQRKQRPDAPLQAQSPPSRLKPSPENP